MGQFAWIVKFALRMLTFMTHCGGNKLWQQQNIRVLPLTRIDSAALVSSRAVRISSRAVRVFRRYHFDAYGPHTGPFLSWFCKGIAQGGRMGHMIIHCMY